MARPHLDLKALAGRLTPGDRYALATALSFKAALLLLGALSFLIFQDKAPEGRGLWPWLSVWNRWDAIHYLEIAAHGYAPDAPQNLAFFPLFPLLVRLARPFVFNDTLSSAFAVSTVASLCAAVAFYRLARLDLKPRAAGRAVWFLFAFPTAYFLHIGYTEALFLALVCGAVIAARSGNWVRAGLFGALASAARMNGVLLLVVFAAEAAVEWRRRGRPNLACLVAGVATLSGTALYLLVNYQSTGNALAFLTFQKEHWHHNLAPPWVGLLSSIRFAGYASPANAVMVGGMEAVGSVLAFAAGAYAVFRQRLSYGLWVLTNWVLWTSNDFVMSVPRYALAAIPLFLWMGKVTANRTAFAALTAVCVLLQGMFAVIFAQGRWAF